jgi:hypothetical protein
MTLPAGREQWLLWGMFAVFLAATFVTYWRLEPSQTYNFDDTGLSGAVSRSITYLSFPVAIAAIGLLLATGRRDRYVLLGLALCAIAVIPGVNRTSDLRAQWVNVPVAAGALLAAYLCLRTRPPATTWRLDRLRLALIALAALWAFPWVTAAIGLYADSIPGLGFVQAGELTPGRPELASVHHGLHEGLFGAQLAIVALVAPASLARPGRLVPAVLSLMLVYGLMVAAADGWNEQFVKRGWLDTQLPNPLEPGLTRAWAIALPASAAVYLVWFARPLRRPAPPPPAPQPPAATSEPAPASLAPGP